MSCQPKTQRQLQLGILRLFPKDLLVFKHKTRYLLLEVN